MIELDDINSIHFVPNSWPPPPPLRSSEGDEVVNLIGARIQWQPGWGKWEAETVSQVKRQKKGNETQEVRWTVDLVSSY